MPRDFNFQTNSQTIRQLQDGIRTFELAMHQTAMTLAQAQAEVERCQKEHDRMVAVYRGYVAELLEIEEKTGRKFSSAPNDRRR
jgi:arginine deiminase